MIFWRIAAFACMLAAPLLLAASPANAATAAGTVISSTMSASYQDALSNNYSATSNTVTTTVQNSPSVILSGSPQNVTAGEIVVDTFTLTNNGNNSGTFTLTADATFAGTASGTSLRGYVLSGAQNGTCSVATPCSYTTLNAQSAMTSTYAYGATVTIGVEYTAGASATPAQTIQTTLVANIAYAATGGATAQNANGQTTLTDTLQSDARLDIQASASSPGSSGANITWTITANNGGAYAAQDLLSAKTVLGAAASGIAIFIPLPVLNSTYLTLQAQPSAPTLNGSTSGAAASVYYNATACSNSPTSGWSTTYSSSAKCIALYLSGGTGGVELPSAPSGSSGAGSVTTAQITFSFSTNQPSGTGSGNANSVTLVANSALGGNTWATGAIPIVGQGLAVGASTDAATASLLSAIQSNATASSGTTPPGGSSNSAGSQAFASYIVGNGPYNNPDASGWYPGASGTPAADNAHDFEALNVACANNSSYGVNGSACTVGTNIILINTVKNEGNGTDTIKLTATAPVGWKVQLYNVTGCSDFIGTGCTQGSSITGQSTDGGSVNGTVSIASNASLNYEAVYNATGNSATAFTAYTTQIAAAGQSGSGTGSDANNTFNTLYPGGVVKVTNSVSSTTSTCAGTPANTGACPGSTLTYSLAYQNVAPAAVASNLGTEPAFAYNALYTTAGSLVLTNDMAANPPGATSANNGATYTNGIQAAASDTTSNTVFTYYTSGGSTTSTFPGPTKLTAQIGGASYQLAPGGSGTITFTAVVK